MKYAPLFLLAACTSAPATDPVLAYDPGPWFVGEANTMHVEWPQQMSCSNDGWNCDYGPVVEFQVDKISCTGCDVSDASFGVTGNATSFTFTANTTDAISIDVDVSSGGESRHLTATGVGDRELAVTASCDIMFKDYLESSELPTSPCDASRTSDEAVVVAWYIRTLRGERVPFCPDDAISCMPDYPRKTSQIEMTPVPQIWWAGTVPIYTSIDAPSITITVPLADGSLSSATIAVPTLTPSP